MPVETLGHPLLAHHIAQLLLRGIDDVMDAHLAGEVEADRI